MNSGWIYTKKLKNGQKRYEARTTVNGKSVGKRFRRKVDAKEWLARLTVNVSDGVYRELKKGTFSDYIEHWKDTHLLPSRYKPSTLNGYRCCLEKWVIGEFAQQYGYYPIAGISSAEINAFAAEMQKTKTDEAGKIIKKASSCQTVNNVLGILRRIFRDAISDSYIRHSPMEGVRKLKIQKRKKGRALKPAEIQAIVAALKGEPRLMVLMAILTGMRQGEQFGLQWEDFDFDNNVIRVRNELFWRYGKYTDRKAGEPKWTLVTVKSEKSNREVDLSPTLRKELLALWMEKGKPKRGFVFRTSNGTPHDPSNIVDRHFKPALKTAEIEGKVRWHDLRHTFWGVED